MISVIVVPLQEPACSAFNEIVEGSSEVGASPELEVGRFKRPIVFSKVVNG